MKANFTKPEEQKELCRVIDSSIFMMIRLTESAGQLESKLMESGVKDFVSAIDALQVMPILNELCEIRQLLCQE